MGWTGVKGVLGGAESRPDPPGRLRPLRLAATHLVALIENMCAKLSLCFGSRHQPSSLRFMAG